MNCYLLISDQLINWSEYERCVVSLSTEKEEKFSKETTLIRSYGYQRIINRKIQALRETNLQMCSRSRPWSQILPIQKYSWKSSKDGIYSSERQGKNSSLCSEFHGHPKTVRRNLRNQSRALSKRETISEDYENIIPTCVQLFFCCNCNCKHAAKSFNFGGYR